VEGDQLGSNISFSCQRPEEQGLSYKARPDSLGALNFPATVDYTALQQLDLSRCRLAVVSAFIFTMKSLRTL